MNSTLKWLFICYIALFTHKMLSNNDTKVVYTNEDGEREIVVLVPSYNNREWYIRNLDSLLCQKYKNFSIIYINDCSTDGTGELVAQYIQDKHLEDKVTLINNKERKGALENLYNAIHQLTDTTIVVTVDGDDWLNNDQVFSAVNEAYADPEIWLTYGNYTHYPYNKNSRSCCEEFPKKIIINNQFREYRWVTSHLRTFYAFLFKEIKLEDLMYEGKFFTMTWDQAFMLPMLEMCGGRFKFLKDKSYVYNIANPINDSKKNEKFQMRLERFIHKKEKYKRLANIKLVSQVVTLSSKQITWIMSLFQ